MNPYYLLFPAAVFHLMGSWVSYDDHIRRMGCYLPIMALLSAVTGMLFAVGAILLDSKEKVYVFSLYYDVIMLAAYYIIPLFLFDVKPNIGIMIGTIFILLGILTIKACE